MLTARTHLAAAVVNGKIYVMGGRAEGDNKVGGIDLCYLIEACCGFAFFQTVLPPSAECYDPVTERWFTIAPPLNARSGASAVVMDGKVSCCFLDLGR